MDSGEPVMNKEKKDATEMDKFIKRLSNLLSVKSIVTIVATCVFAILSMRETISSKDFMSIFIMIIGFSYFYSSIQFNPVEIANNLKKQGGFIPGFRPGKPTVDFIKKVLNKITLFGAIYLGIVAICPLLAGKLIDNSSIAIGGTSVIIVVGVALETVKALESQMLMRQYKGFLE